MTSRQRFECVCRHERPDRFPIDYLGHPATDGRLKRHYGVETEDDLLAALGSDFYYLSCRDISQNESCFPIYRGPKLAVTEAERVCPFGIRWKRGVGEAKFAADEPLAGPLRNATEPKDILDHSWPEPDWFDFDALLSECERHGDKVIVGGMWAGILGDSFRMHGFENFLLNMAENPPLVKTLVDRMTDFYMELNERAFSILGGKIDVWFFGNDFGSQNGLLFSKEMFEDFFYDNIDRLIAHARTFGLTVMMHSCGAVAELIPLLRAAGVEILDPIQVTARDMEPAALAERFSGQIVFHGGVDTQQVLPNGTPEGVYRHATDVLQKLGQGYGYIFAPDQILLPDVPVENIDAMYRAGREYRPE